MFVLKVSLWQLSKRIKFVLRLLLLALNFIKVSTNRTVVVEQFLLVGPESLGVLIMVSCFVGLVFTFQIAKEFLYLDLSNLIGAVLSISFIRELSPVLTAIIAISRVGSSFTAELASMKITEQIDALYLLKTDPILYLIFPRLLACTVMLPVLNLIFFLTSLSSSIFICFIFYNINPTLFVYSSLSVLSYHDVLKTTLKSVVFGLFISSISCAWGLTTISGSKNLGQSTTSAVVTNLLVIFLLNAVLTHILFGQTSSVIKSL